MLSTCTLSDAFLAFQPVIDLRYGEVAYVETYVQPASLRREVESHGDIAALDLHVLALLGEYLSHAAPVRLAVNVAPATLLRHGDEISHLLSALPRKRRPLLELNDPYLLEADECAAIRSLLEKIGGVELGINHYQGTQLEDELLATLRPAWAKLDGDCLKQHLAGHGCNALQQAVESCRRYDVRLAVTRIDSEAQLRLIRSLCGLRWGQGRLLAAEQNHPAFPSPIHLPSLATAEPMRHLHAEGCWHCLYSRLLEEESEISLATSSAA